MQMLLNCNANDSQLQCRSPTIIVDYLDANDSRLQFAGHDYLDANDYHCHLNLTSPTDQVIDNDYHLQSQTGINFACLYPALIT